MGNYSPGSTVVLTTHERSSYFYAALGNEIDVHFDPKHDPDLKDMLYNISVSGGKLVVIDEDYFTDSADMVCGLEEFIDGSNRSEHLNFIVVCSHRNAGDPLLAHLVTYCQIFDVVYGKQGVDIVLALTEVLNVPRKRFQTAELVHCARWNEKACERTMGLRSRDVGGSNNKIASLKLFCSDHMFSRELVIDMGRLQGMSIQFKP